LALSVYFNRLYATVGSGASGGGDLFNCIPTTGTNAEFCDATADWSRVLDSTFTYESIESAVVYNNSLYLGMGQTSGQGDLVRCDSGAAGDDTLCDNNSDLGLVVNNTAAFFRIPAMIVYDGSLFLGYEGNSSGDGRIVEYRESYVSTTNVGTGFQSTLSFATYNGYLYAGRGNAAGNGQVFYFHKNRTISNNVAFEAGSSTASIWLSNEAHNFQGEGSDTVLTDSVFKFSTGIITEAGAYDLAEMYPVAEPDLTAGDVVALDESGGGGIRKAVGGVDDSILGVISTRPGFTLSAEDTEGMLPVALAGRVPVKVSAENGDIAIGDTLVPASLPGFAMKGTLGGTMVGMALQGFSSTDAATGTIMMAVQKGVFLGTSSTSTLSFALSTTSTSFLQPSASLPEIALPAGSLIAQGLQVQTLIVGDAVVTGSLNVIGATVLQGPLTIAAPFSGTVSVPPQTSDVVVQGSFPALPRILLTPEVVIPQADSPLRPEDMWDGSFYLTNVSSSGFTIHLPRGGYCTQYNPCPKNRKRRMEYWNKRIY
jgi:hypothetical protein